MINVYDGLYLGIIPYILTILPFHIHRHIQSVVACIFFDQKELIGIAGKDETRYIHLGSFFCDGCTPIKPHIHTYGSPRSTLMAPKLLR